MDANAGKKSVDPILYHAYAAEMERKFKETASSSKWYAEYQARARKAAAVAKEKAAEQKAAEKKAVESEAAMTLKVLSASPEVAAGSTRKAAPIAGKKRVAGSEAVAPSKSVVPPKAVSTSSPESIVVSDSDEPAVSLSVWQLREKRIKKEHAEGSHPVGNAPLRRTGADRQPPDWYKQLPKPKGDRARQSDAEIAISRLKAHISRVMAEKSALAKEGREIAERLHALLFLPVDAKLLRQTRILDNKDGLPQLFDSAFTNGIDWPYYLRADAEELYNKWYTGEFETDLYRGLIRGLATKKGKGKAKVEASVADRLANGHQRFRLMDPKQHGNGLLLNGAWFPSQLAALRDGGHGSSQGGITGNPTSGAYSVIMAGGVDPSGQPYPNEDRGSEVLYCGTDNKDKTRNQPSPETASLLTNHRTKQPVRLFRSQNLDSPFAPELGFRYDGLYDVASYEDMDPPDNKRRRHRFKLVRRAEQDPIRSQGAAKRPTKQEIDEYEKDKKNRGR
jgi:hypothetical protein